MPATFAGTAGTRTPIPRLDRGALRAPTGVPVAALVVLLGLLGAFGVALTGSAAASDPTAQPSTGPAPGGSFGWPLAGQPIVLRAFDPPPQPYGRGHRGVDLGGGVGEAVLAAGDGTVVFAGLVAGRPVVSIDHPNGLRTTYEPVPATVSAGQLVSRGEQIGVLQAGHPECLATACLHWGLRRGEVYLDPLRLLFPGRVRLLPTG